jgi:hypothetical protein
VAQGLGKGREYIYEGPQPIGASDPVVMIQGWYFQFCHFYAWSTRMPS